MGPNDPSLDVKVRVGTEGASAGEKAIEQLGRKAAETNRAVKTESHEAVRGMAEVRRTALETEEAFHGLERASEGGAEGLRGLAGAGRGALGVLRSLAGTFSTDFLVATGAAVAGVGAAIWAMGQRAKKVGEENQAALDGAKARAEGARSAIALLDAESQKSLQKQLEKVKEIAAAYQQLGEIADEFYDRQQKLIEVADKKRTATDTIQEQKELLQAGTPEQREAIRKRYESLRAADTRAVEDRDLGNRERRAQGALELAAGESSQLLERRISATIKAVTADSRRADAAAAFSAINQSLTEHPDNNKIIQAAAQAKTEYEQADAEAKKAAENLTNVLATIDKELEAIGKKTREEKDELDLVAAQRDLLKTQRTAEAQGRRELIDIGTAAPALPNGQTVEDYIKSGQNIGDAGKKAAKAQQDRDDEILDVFQQMTRQATDFEQQMRNSRPSG